MSGRNEILTKDTIYNEFRRFCECNECTELAFRRDKDDKKVAEVLSLLGGALARVYDRRITKDTLSNEYIMFCGHCRNEIDNQFLRKAAIELIFWSYPRLFG